MFHTNNVTYQLYFTNGLLAYIGNSLTHVVNETMSSRTAFLASMVPSAPHLRNNFLVVYILFNRSIVYTSESYRLRVSFAPSVGGELETGRFEFFNRQMTPSDILFCLLLDGTAHIL